MSDTTRYPTYSKCRECGYVEDGVCGISWGYACENCGAVDTTDIVRRRKRSAQVRQTEVLGDE